MKFEFILMDAIEDTVELSLSITQECAESFLDVHTLSDDIREGTMTQVYKFGGLTGYISGTTGETDETDLCNMAEPVSHGGH